MRERLQYIVDGCRGEDRYRAGKVDVVILVLAALIFSAACFAVPWLGL